MVKNDGLGDLGRKGAPIYEEGHVYVAVPRPRIDELSIEANKAIQLDKVNKNGYTD